MHFISSYKLLASALLAIITAISGQAGAVAITNFSFEQPSASNNPNPGCPQGWTCITAGNSFGGGVYTPTTVQYPIGSNGLSGGLIVPNGTQAAYVDTGIQITQNTAATFVTGQQYTLTVWAGWRNDNTGAWSNNAAIEFLAGGTAVKVGAVLSPGQGHWARTTLNYTATAADNGKIIGVGLLGNNTSGVQVNWDDVGLAPEPSSLLLLGMGFGVLALVIRRKRKISA